MTASDNRCIDPNLQHLATTIEAIQPFPLNTLLSLEWKTRKPPSCRSEWISHQILPYNFCFAVAVISFAKFVLNSGKGNWTEGLSFGTL